MHGLFAVEAGDESSEDVREEEEAVDLDTALADEEGMMVLASYGMDGQWCLGQNEEPDDSDRS